MESYILLRELWWLIYWAILHDSDADVACPINSTLIVMTMKFGTDEIKQYLDACYVSSYEAFGTFISFSCRSTPPLLFTFRSTSLISSLLSLKRMKMATSRTWWIQTQTMISHLLHGLRQMLSWQIIAIFSIKIFPPRWFGTRRHTSGPPGRRESLL